tara:strand:- start:1248 stop:1373 length:126 start_codon:yes stop_codon:yes gene_type:complete
MNQFDDKDFKENGWTIKDILLLTYIIGINILTISLIIFFVL